MAINAFNHVEAGVSLSDQATTTADLRALHHPAEFYPLLSRSILHETLHLWQYLSSGYLMGLVEEDWERLKTYERDGMAASLGPRGQAFRKRSDLLPFSAKELHEGLARFWDMHILGPPLLIELELADPKRTIPADFADKYRKEKAAGRITHPETGGYSSLSFQMAMECAAGDYGKPFLWLRQQTNDLLANILFPLCGYYAFQTPDPLRGFNLLARQGSHEFPNLYSDRAIHEWWREGFFRLGRLAVQAAHQLGGNSLEHMGTAVTEGALTDHPTWALLFELRRGAAVHFKTLPLFDPLPDVDPNQHRQIHGQLNLEYALACPGDPDYRGMLVQCLAPSTVRFADETIWNLGALAALQVRDQPLWKMHHTIENESGLLRTRWCRFVLAKFGYGPDCHA